MIITHCSEGKKGPIERGPDGHEFHVSEECREHSVAEI